MPDPVATLPITPMPSETSPALDPQLQPTPSSVIPSSPALLPKETFKQGLAQGATGTRYVADAQGNIVPVHAPSSMSAKGTFGRILASAALGALTGAQAARPGGIPSEQLEGGVGAGERASLDYLQKRDLMRREQAQQNFANTQNVKQLNREEAESAARIAQYTATTAKQVQETKFEEEEHPFNLRHLELGNESAVQLIKSTQLEMSTNQLKLMETLAANNIKPTAEVTSWLGAQQYAGDIATGRLLPLWNGKHGEEQSVQLFSTGDLNRPLTKEVTFPVYTAKSLQEGVSGEPGHKPTKESEQTLQPGANTVGDYLAGQMMAQAQLNRSLSIQKMQGEIEFQKSEVKKNEATAVAERARAGMESAQTRFTQEQIKQLGSFGTNISPTAQAPAGAFQMTPQQLGQALTYEGQQPPKNFETLYAMGHYKADPNTFPAFVRPMAKGQIGAPQMDRQTAVNFIRRFINPDYDENNFSAVKKLEADFATGKAGGNLVSFNTATRHLGQLYEAATELHNGQLTPSNALVNYASQVAGKPVKPNFDAIRNVLTGELGRLMKQAAPDVAEMGQINEALNSSSSPEQFRVVTEQFAHAMLAKGLEQVNHYYAYTGELPPGAISPQASAVYQRMGIDVASLLPQASSPNTLGANSQPTTAALKPAFDQKTNRWSNLPPPVPDANGHIVMMNNRPIVQLGPKKRDGWAYFDTGEPVQTH